MPSIPLRVEVLLFGPALGDLAAPWNDVHWSALFDKVPQENYPHMGLFPENDDDLPANLTRAQSNAIRAFQDAALKIKVRNQLCKFVCKNSLDGYEGRAIYATWWADIMARSRLNNTIDSLIVENGRHPAVLRRAKLSAHLRDSLDGLRYIVATDVFGGQCLVVKKGQILGIHPTHLHLINSLVKMAWKRLDMRGKSWEKKLKQLVSDVNLTHKKMQNPDVTTQTFKSFVNNATRQTKKLQDMAGFLGGVDEVIEIREAVDKMHGLIEVIKGNRPRSFKNCALLATEEDIHAVVAYYMDHFINAIDEVAEVPSISMRAFDCDGDLGIQEYFGLDERALWQLLGIKNNGHVPFWNDNLPLSEDTLWDKPDLLDDPSSPSIPCRLRWSQLTAIASIYHMVTHPESADYRRGVLLADEVGVGKTGTILGFMALYINAYIRFQAGGTNALPPVFGGFKRFGTSNTLSMLSMKDRTWLVVAPPTLLTQWYNEIKRFWLPNSIDVFIYGGGKSCVKFWDENSDWNKSKQRKCNRIILASYTALVRDGKDALEDLKEIQAHGVARRRRAVHSNTSQTRTLFDLEYIAVAFDEAHYIRTRSKPWVAALSLRDLSCVVILATATPLYTSVTDIFNLQRVAGIGDYLDILDEQEIECRREIDKKKREARKKSLGLATSKEQTELFQQEQVKKHRLAFKGRIIRRTPASLRPDGNPITDIPNYETHAGFITLSSAEMAVLDGITRELSEDHQTGVFIGSEFYLRYRQAIAYYKPIRRMPRTLEEWEKIKSTKMDMVARLCKHLLSDDDAPLPPSLPENENREFIIPSHTPLDGCKQTRKVLIYQEFRSMARLLGSVLDLYGVESVSIGGDVPFAKRQKIVYEFMTDSECRVMIISKVAGSGLNLTSADSVIFMDQPWSGQDEIQAIGRCWRPPQQKTCHIFYVLARNTTDFMMARVAANKTSLLGTFLDHKIQSPLQPFLQATCPVSEEEVQTTVSRMLRDENEDNNDENDNDDGVISTSARGVNDKVSKTAKRKSDAETNKDHGREKQAKLGTTSDGKVPSTTHATQAASVPGTPQPTIVKVEPL